MSFINQILLETKWNAYVIHKMGTNQQLSTSKILMQKCADDQRLTTLHLEYVNCPIFLTTYMQRIPKI